MAILYSKSNKNNSMVRVEFWYSTVGNKSFYDDVVEYDYVKVLIPSFPEKLSKGEMVNLLDIAVHNNPLMIIRQKEGDDIVINFNDTDDDLGFSALPNLSWEVDYTSWESDKDGIYQSVGLTAEHEQR